MISLEEALSLLNGHLSAVAAQEGAEVTVTSATRVQGGWRFEYNTVEFATKGDELDALVGNRPLLVDDAGAVGAA